MFGRKNRGCLTYDDMNGRGARLPGLAHSQSRARNPALLLVVILAVASALQVVDENCQVRDGSVMICRCATNEEFFLPEEYDYRNISSLEVSSCVSANLHFSSLTQANQISEIVVWNITDRLLFELYVASRKLRRCELSQVRRIPFISHDTFVNLQEIGALLISEAFIERFEEDFADIAVGNFVMMNVTVGQIDGVNFSEKGDLLRITNTEFRNVTGSLHFEHFTRVQISGSRFALQNPGNLLLVGEVVHVSDSIFLNASISLTASSSIVVNGICADGRSTLRLLSGRVESLNNRLPTQIVYVRNADATDLLDRNNTICIAGNCKCPEGNRKNGQNKPSPLIVQITFSLFLLSTFF